MKKISKNFLALFLSDGLTRLIGFAATIYIARLLAVEGFGLINYGLAFISYALLFANPGLTVIGAREVAKAPHNLRFIEETLGLRLALAIAIFVIFLCGTRFVPGDVTTKRIIISYSLTLFPFAILLEFVFQGREEMSYIGVERIIQNGVYLAILLVFLKGGSDIIVVPVAFVIGYLIAALFLLAVFSKKYGTFRFRFSVSAWQGILKASIPVGLAIIFNQVTISLPPIILGIFRTNYEVGIFSAAYKIVFLLLIIERVFYYVFFPILSKQYKEEPEKLHASFNMLTRFLFAITIPLTFGGLVIAERVIGLVYGSAFSAASNVMRVLLVYFMIVPVNTIYGYGLIALDGEKRFFKIITFTATICTVLLIVLGIRFGMHGAAVALLFSESIGIICMNRALKEKVRFETLRYIVKPLLASLLMSLLLVVFRGWHWAVVLLIGICAYFIVLYLIRGFSRADLVSIKGLIAAD